jgi:putative effector of murein hydrolase LrgA (UPF0299 family)
LIPASLGWFLLLAAQRVGRDQDWNVVVVTLASIIVLLACFGLMVAALRVSARLREREGAMF